MGTMKEGPGSDPFDDADEEHSEQSGKNDSSSSETTESTESQMPQQSDQSAPAVSQSSANKYPYVLRRDTVKDERTNEHVALLRDEFASAESDIQSTVADQIGIEEKAISVFDLREALWQLGQENPDRIAEILLDWGYDAKVD